MAARYSLCAIAAAGLSLFATGCVAPAPGTATVPSASLAPAWPPPPAEARVRYVRSVSGPSDLGITKGIVQRIVSALSGNGGDEHFVRPTGVAEHAGVVYVADPGAPALWILDTKRQSYVKVSEVDNKPLSSPVAVAVGPDRSVFLADTGLKRVFLLDDEGKLVRVVAGSELERPAALAYDGATGRLYVADAVRHRIGVYDPSGALTDAFGRPGTKDGELNYPTHLCLDPAGALLATDAMNFRIEAFAHDGRFLWKLGHHGDGSGDFAAPKGLAADTAGHVFVVDALFDAVQIFERDGTFLLSFGSRGTEPGQFALPGGIFINAQDQVYVADAYNRRVQVFAVGASATLK